MNHNNILNKYTYGGIIFTIILFICIYYIYNKYYDHNNLKFISFENHNYKYKINYHQIDIIIPKGYTLINKNNYYDNEYIIGKFKKDNLTCLIKLNYNKNYIINPVQDKNFIESKDMLIDFYKSLDNDEIFKHIILDNCTNICATVREICFKIEDINCNYTIEIEMLKDNFIINIQLELENKNKLTKSQLYDIYLPWKNCNITTTKDDFNTKLKNIEDSLLMLKE